MSELTPEQALKVMNQFIDDDVCFREYEIVKNYIEQLQADNRRLREALKAALATSIDKETDETIQQALAQTDAPTEAEIREKAAIDAARIVFDCGSGYMGERPHRIAFMVGGYPNERQAGGLCESALRSVLIGELRQQGKDDES